MKYFLFSMGLFLVSTLFAQEPIAESFGPIKLGAYYEIGTAGLKKCDADKGEVISCLTEKGEIRTKEAVLNKFPLGEFFYDFDILFNEKSAIIVGVQSKYHSRLSARTFLKQVFDKRYGDSKLLDSKSKVMMFAKKCPDIYRAYVEPNFLRIPEEVDGLHYDVTVWETPKYIAFSFNNMSFVVLGKRSLVENEKVLTEKIEQASEKL